jgi:surface protein with Ig-like domain
MKRTINLIALALLFSIVFISSCKKDDTGDGTTPEIIIIGFNPVNTALDNPYIDSGATAFDITPAGDTVDLTASIVIENNVDVSTEGDYTVVYNVKDESGVAAEEKVRKVKVVIGK